MMTDVNVERRSLELGKWGNLFMGVAGIVAAWLSRSDALLVDGLYSGVNFASAIVAARIGASIARPADRNRPFGYDVDEALYVKYRSLVLVGIIAFAMLSAAIKIITYATGGEVPELVFGPIIGYVVLMVVIFLGLAAWHHRNWRLSGKRSQILRTESKAALIDGAISAGAGGGLIAVPFLQGTLLEPILPVADAVIVLLMSAVIIRQPAFMFLGALREVAGGTAEAPIVEEIRSGVEHLLRDRPFDLLEIVVTRMGRSYFVAAYVRPEQAMTASEADTLRDDLQQLYDKQLKTVKSELIFTARHPFPSASPSD